MLVGFICLFFFSISISDEISWSPLKFKSNQKTKITVWDRYGWTLWTAFVLNPWLVWSRAQEAPHFLQTKSLSLEHWWEMDISLQAWWGSWLTWESSEPFTSTALWAIFLLSFVVVCCSFPFPLSPASLQHFPPRGPLNSLHISILRWTGVAVNSSSLASHSSPHIVF